VTVTPLVAPGRTDNDPQRLNKSFVQNQSSKVQSGLMTPLIFFFFFFFMHDPYPHGGNCNKMS
jgi:hypothetical protein